jgi:ATP synthase subunit 6
MKNFFFSPLEQFEVFTLGSFFGVDSMLNLILTNEVVTLLLIFFFLTLFFKALLKKSSRPTFFLVPNRYNVILGLLEKLVLSLVKENIKDQTSALVVPFVFCLFVFLICLNMIGMIPYAFTLTSHIAISLNLSLTAFIMINILAARKYGLKMFSLFLPGGTSVVLALLLVPIELVSFAFKPISLSIRLFANLMAGHTLLKVIAGFAYTLATAGGFLCIVGFIPLLILIPLFFLEFAVALIQAFVFTVLICIYYNDSNNISH